MTTTLRELSEPAVLTPSHTPTPGAAIPVRSTPTQESDDTAARRSVARAMWIGTWIWPAYTLLDVYMCFVAYPGAPFRVFVLCVDRSRRRGVLERRRKGAIQ